MNPYLTVHRLGKKTRLSNKEYEQLHAAWDKLCEIDQTERTSRLIENMLRHAVEQDVDSIRIRKIKNVAVVIEYVTGLDVRNVGEPEVDSWNRLISRIKILAGAIDYGVNRTESAEFEFDIGNDRTGRFLLTTNPNPFRDSEVVVDVLGTATEHSTSTI